MKDEPLRSQRNSAWDLPASKLPGIFVANPEGRYITVEQPGIISYDLLASYVTEPVAEDAQGVEAPAIELDNLLRNDDKLYLIERLIEQQAPLGTDMANFRRRLLLVVRA